MLTLSSLIDRISRWFGLDSSSLDARLKSEIIKATNDTLKALGSLYNWSWLKAVYRGRFAAPVSLSNLTVTQESCVVQGAANGEYIFRLISFGSDPQVHFIRRIDTTVGAEKLFLESPYTGASSSSATATLYDAVIILPEDCRKITEVYVDGKALTFISTTVSALTKTTSPLIGNPTKYLDYGRVDKDYDPFTVTLNTQGDDYVSHSTTFINDYQKEGRTIRIGSQIFYVREYSGSEIRLDRPFNATAGDYTAKFITQYTKRIMVYPFPNEAKAFEVWYYRFPAEVLYDNDVIEIPEGHENVIVYGTLLRLKSFFEDQLQLPLQLILNNFAYALERLAADNGYAIEKGVLSRFVGIGSIDWRKTPPMKAT